MAKVTKRKWTALSFNQKITVILGLTLLLTSIFASGSSFYYSAKSYDLQIANTNLQKENIYLQNKQTNYPIQAFEYPIEAIVEGGYVNHTTDPTYSYGFLNTTIIISTPDITRLIMENCSFTPNYNEKNTIIGKGYLDLSKISEWSEDFGTDSGMRSQWYNYNNFTYYTSQEGINTISVSIPLDVTFYMNPSYNFQSSTVSSPICQVNLGYMIVTANITDMQTNNQTQISFGTELYAYVKIS